MDDGDPKIGFFLAGVHFSPKDCASSLSLLKIHIIVCRMFHFGQSNQPTKNSRIVNSSIFVV